MKCLCAFLYFVHLDPHMVLSNCSATLVTFNCNIKYGLMLYVVAWEWVAFTLGWISKTSTFDGQPRNDNSLGVR